MSKNEALRIEIIQLHHNVPVAGYGGRWKTTELVTRDYWQPGVIRNVRKYVNRYNICQKMKNRIEMPTEKLKLSEVPEKL